RPVVAARGAPAADRRAGRRGPQARRLATAVGRDAGAGGRVAGGGPSADPGRALAPRAVAVATRPDAVRPVAGVVRVLAGAGVPRRSDAGRAAPGPVPVPRRGAGPRLPAGELRAEPADRGRARRPARAGPALRPPD